jgi:hypothetical protein
MGESFPFAERPSSIGISVEARLEDEEECGFQASLAAFLDLHTSS